MEGIPENGGLMGSFTFPKDFFFGASICDYQHFGGSNCDLPTIPASKHFEYYEDDFKLLKQLNLDALRTSIEWARVEPEEGEFDEKSLEFYHTYLSKLKETGATTVVTLHHFTNPKWIHKHGGWLSEEVVENFLEYVNLVAREFDEYIDYYVTVNEPAVYAMIAYNVGNREGVMDFHLTTPTWKRP